MSSPGAGCISADPAFAAPEACEYHLTSGSPCVDAGTETPGVTTDLDGNPRSVDGDNDSTAVPDMGCYEFGSGPWHIRLISQARWLPDNTDIRLSDKRVTAAYNDSFYIQEMDRSAGIRVTGIACEEDMVDVQGVLDTVDGERVINQQ